MVTGKRLQEKTELRSKTKSQQSLGTNTWSSIKTGAGLGDIQPVNTIKIVCSTNGV
jgi:hypothetical protein